MQDRRYKIVDGKFKLIGPYATARMFQLLYERVTDKIDSETFVRLMQICILTHGVYSPFPLDSGYVRGDWDHIMWAHGDGHITTEEYLELAKNVIFEPACEMEKEEQANIPKR